MNAHPEISSPLGASHYTPVLLASSSRLTTLVIPEPQ